MGAMYHDFILVVLPSVGAWVCLIRFGVAVATCLMALFIKSGVCLSSKKKSSFEALWFVGMDSYFYHIFRKTY